jgi:hypothetical protein
MLIDVRLRLTPGCSEKIQLSSLIGAFHFGKMTAKPAIALFNSVEWKKPNCIVGRI